MKCKNCGDNMTVVRDEIQWCPWCGSMSGKLSDGVILWGTPESWLNDMRSDHVEADPVIVDEK